LPELAIRGLAQLSTDPLANYQGVTGIGLVVLAAIQGVTGIGLVVPANHGVTGIGLVVPANHGVTGIGLVVPATLVLVATIPRPIAAVTINSPNTAATFHLFMTSLRDKKSIPGEV
jgi:hypothetical protein